MIFKRLQQDERAEILGVGRQSLSQCYMGTIKQGCGKCGRVSHVNIRRETFQAVGSASAVYLSGKAEKQ